MDNLYNDILSANNEYSSKFDKSDLEMPPARKLAILTCMDARLDPMRFAGLSLGDAHIVRNAGGRASDDAIRSLVISHRLLGTNEWFIIHHSDCGMETFKNEEMHNILAESSTSESIEGKFINWLTIEDQKSSVIDDVTRIRNHILVPDEISIYGFIFDVKTGELNEVKEASEIGLS